MVLVGEHTDPAAPIGEDIDVWKRVHGRRERPEAGPKHIRNFDGPVPRIARYRHIAYVRGVEDDATRTRRAEAELAVRRARLIEGIEARTRRDIQTLAVANNDGDVAAKRGDKRNTLTDPSVWPYE
jgi:hypothetical protein